MLWTISRFILPAALMVVMISCNYGVDPEETNMVQNWRPFNGQSLSRTAMARPGALHNEVLHAFNIRHSLVTCDGMEINDFVRIVVESVNEVLTANDEITRISERDVTFLMRVFTSLSQQRIFDFYGRETPNPHKLINFLLDHGMITGSDAAEIIRILNLIPKMTAPLNALDEASVSQAVEDANSWCAFMSADILHHSRIYWFGINAERSLSVFDSDKQNRTHKVSVSDIGSAVGDIVGGLVGYVFGGVGAIVGAPIGSLMFEMGLDGLNGAIETLDDGDYCWPSDWSDDVC